MKCPVCNTKSQVIGSKTDCEAVYRKRKCPACGYVFYTAEVDGDWDDYDRAFREYNRDYYKNIRKKRRGKNENNIATTN